MTLRIERIELREIEMALKWPFETSFGRTTKRQIMIVRVFDRSGAVGYGECTAGEDPFYNHETIDTAWLIISKYVAPMLFEASVSSALDAGSVLEPIRGNRMAKGAVEVALWDLEARMSGAPLWRQLGGTKPEIASGVSIGLQSSIDALLEKVDRELESGYQRIKIKIKPGRDIDLVAAIRKQHPNIKLTVDANSAYSLDDIELFRKLDEYNLLFIEQPLAAGDLIDHSKLQKQIRTPLCLDESILTAADARHAIELGSCKVINIKLGRVGGHAEAKRIHDFCLSKDVPVWCGGMLEAGVGRAHNIAMSTHPGFSLPGDVSASARYWEEDIIEPAVTVSPSGTISVPAEEGIGFKVNEVRIEKLTTRREELKP